ncbi:hypothetical protein [Streptomyces sp. NPDC048603]|uniref:hypothetical protein n=1 Tax=Streptomyces sp. NPDC048603 TaxID=3365577 RepID=UPI003714951C
METVTPHDGAPAISRLASWIRDVTTRLDPGSGWYGEFLRRDPEGMRACLDGTALVPWDVLESLLHDLAAIRGPEAAAGAGRWAAELRRAATAEYDGRPGGAEELRHLLAVAAAQRSSSEAALRTLSAGLAAATDPAETDFLTRELTWTQDDLTRAASRCTDLAARLASVTEQRPAPAAAAPTPAADRPRKPGVPARPPAPEGTTHPAPHRPVSPVRPAEGQASGTAGTGAAGGPAEAAAARRWLRGSGRRTGGARYAGAEGGGPAVLPDLGGALAGGASPRGARFGPPADRTPSAADTPPAPPPAETPEPARQPAAAPADAWSAAPAPGTGHWQSVVPAGRPGPGAPSAGEPGPAPGDGSGAGPAVPQFVAELIALRGQGRSGEAHVLLCEAAAWPAEALPGLARELERAGLGADWATLLWEAAASLPPDRLAAAAAALGTAGLDTDRGRLLRQGVTRPAAEIAEAALALDAAGRRAEADMLLSAFVRVRSPEDAARLARRDPHALAPRLLDAAGRVSAACRHGLVHALRVAGVKADRG